MSAARQDRGRFSSKRKMEAVLCLLGGEDLDLLSRELGVAAGTLSDWRSAFLAGGQARLKSRRPDSRDEEIRTLKTMVGDLTMRLELSREAVERMKGTSPPFVPRRSTG